jgi:EpsI family protein
VIGTPLRRRMLLALGGAVAVSVGARSLEPTDRLADRWGELNLDAEVPKSFGEWAPDLREVRSVVNPQQEQLIKTLYSQILTRTYRAKDGYGMMVSIAYGREQLNDLRAHFPEVCYAAQGFKVREQSLAVLKAGAGSVSVRRLDTLLGNTRPEPVTYWLMVGDQQQLGGYRAKMAEMRFTLRRLIPDGLLFRVSSIDPDAGQAFARQERFIADLLGQVRPEARRRLAGF